jgi:hypothetical protein
MTNESAHATIKALGNFGKLHIQNVTHHTAVSRRTLPPFRHFAC